MSSESLYLLAADAMLLGHVLYVAFVVLGFVAVLLGGVLGWGWVRNPWFRYLHLLAIGVVVVQSWFGIICPLTTWEMALRSLAGDTVYAGSFIAHWLGKLLYYNAPEWVFVLVYSAFGLLVVSSWYFVRPRGYGVRRKKPFTHPVARPAQDRR